MRFIAELEFFFAFDQEGNLNIDDPLALGLAVEVPKNELVRVSEAGFDDELQGHHEEDLESWARAEFDEKTTRTKPSIAIRCVFIGIPSLLNSLNTVWIVSKIVAQVEIYFDLAGGVSI
ncbi:MAG: hypothetical protein SFV81_03610 [Pirellulaceae bacterium]|nr:hypothetical protein [Pirellulaceae bacterium]